MNEKLTKIAENSAELYNRCHLRHFSTVMTGDGSESLQFKLPFTPDAIQVICNDPRILFQSYTVSFLNLDLSGLGYIAAVANSAHNGNLLNFAMTTVSVHNRVQEAEDGTVTISNILDLAGSENPCVFGKDLTYVVIATRYTDKTYRQRYEEFVESLTGTGTAHVCKYKIEDAFTAEEWTALKATRPGWTFKEV